MLRTIMKGLLALFALRSMLTGYIDPNTGGMIFQMLAVLVGLLSGVLLFFSGRIRMAIARLKRFVRERREETKEEVAGQESDLTV